MRECLQYVKTVERELKKNLIFVCCGKELPKHFISPECKEEYLETDYEYCDKCGAF